MNLVYLLKKSCKFCLTLFFGGFYIKIIFKITFHTVKWTLQGNVRCLSCGLAYPWMPCYTPQSEGAQALNISHRLINIYCAKHRARQYDKSDTNSHSSLPSRPVEPTEQRRKDQETCSAQMQIYNYSIKNVKYRGKFLDQMLWVFRVRTHCFLLWNQERLFASHSVWSHIQSLPCALLCTARSWLLQTTFLWPPCQLAAARVSEWEAIEKDGGAGGKEKPGYFSLLSQPLFYLYNGKNKGMFSQVFFFFNEN